MTPERWEKIERIYHSALERESGERESFLDQACAGDNELRREIVSLLAHDDSDDGFIAAPALADAAQLMAGDPLMESTATLPDAPAVAKEIGPYKLQTLLGKGGMGEVHLALDTRLNRKVAVKLLPAEFTQDVERLRRFKQEARAASALNHQNVVTIYDIGEAEGAHYLVMEYVEGETLRRRMADAPQRTMKPVEALELAAQVAEALSAAHDAGITHRDIKPENVMIRRDGRVKVLDFGLARLTLPASGPVDSQAPTAAKLDTASGVVMGTASYMSPEQARGMKVDQRTDIFSLGVMLYEMLAGRRPFEGATMSDVIAAVLTREPEPLSRHNKEIEPGLEQVVLKCLAKDPEKRFQTASELVAALKTATKRTTSDEWRSAFKSRLVWAVSALVVLLIAAFAYWKLQPTSPPEKQIRSLAVLPLENLSGDQSQEYFADGMTESLINNLAQIRALRVISRTSVMRFKGSHKSLPEIAQELNVDAVITGSVQRAGAQVKISAQLIRAATDAHLWAREYDYREMADILKLQSEVARAVADEIRIEVTAEERVRLAALRRVKPEAYEAYQLGRYHRRKLNEDDLRLAIEYFERAIQIDPGYAAAWAELSDALRQRGIFGANIFRKAEAPSREAALKAVELDTNLAEAHVALSNVKFFFETDWAGAEREAKRALELDPGSRDAHHAFANLLMALGRHDEAIGEMQIIEGLDPFYSETQSTFGRVLYRAGKYAEAEQRLNRAIELDSRDYAAFGRLGDLYEQMGRYHEAIASLEKAEALRSDSNSVNIRGRLARVYSAMGRRDEARRMLEEIKATTEPNRLPLLPMAAAYTALGDKDEAFKLLFRAIDERNTSIVFVKEDPPLKSLHSDPRWKEALRRMNFPEE
jgi:serine/threonine protein kinase/Tfp pilus assembly protein PilF